MGGSVADARRVLAYLKPEWRLFTGSLGATIIYVIFNSLSVWLLGSLVYTIFGGGESPIPSPDAGGLNEWIKASTQRLIQADSPEATLARVSALIFGTFFFKNIFLYLKNSLISLMEVRLLTRVRQVLFERVLDFPMSFFDQRQTGELSAVVIQDVSKLKTSFTASLQRLITEPINILSFLTLLFVISWKLTLIGMLAFPLSGLVIHRMGQSIKRKSIRTGEQIARLMGGLNQSLSGVRVIQAFGMEGPERSKFGQRSDRLAQIMFRQARLSNVASPATEMIGITIGIFLLWYGGRAVMSGSGLASEDFIRYLFLLFSVMQPIRNLAKVNTQIQDGLGGARRIFELMDTPVSEDRGHVPIHSFEKEIRYENVTFAYSPADGPVLQAIDLEIPQSSTVALVGMSGGGKSTLVDLLPKFYSPTSGRILIDGKNIAELVTADLRALIGSVPQETLLFDETVANNIRFGRPEASDAAVQEAAAAANALEFIRALPNGFQTAIGERGVRLSGGQRQRLAIARAILRNPPILILDEATSALDTEAERAVQEAIDRLVANRTVIVIAHRLSTITQADQIVVMGDGRVVESGTHDDLLSRGGAYRRLFDLQFSRA